MTGICGIYKTSIRNPIPKKESKNQAYLNFIRKRWKISDPASKKSKKIDAMTALMTDLGTNQPVTSALSDHIGKSLSKSE